MPRRPEALHWVGGFEPHRSVEPKRRRRITVALAVTTAVGLSLGLALPAQGTSPQEQLAAKRAEAGRIQQQLQASYDQADQLDEQLVQAQNAVAQTKQKIAQTEQGIADAQAHTADLRRQLGGRAARLYMGAGNSDPIAIDATDVRELGSRAKYSEAAAAQDNRLLDQLHVAQEQLGIEEKNLQDQQAAAEAHQKAVDDARQALAHTTSQQQNLLSQVKGEMATLVHDVEVQRQQAAAAAARAALAQQAAQRANTVGGAGGGGGGGGGHGGGGDLGNDPGPIPAPSGGAGAAIAYARAQVGKPYIYAGTGPDGFDCSGLTMMAWAQGGVSMPHGSQAQYDMFPHVPISQLQPGDLVFFGSSGPSNHHVGLYIGGGTMIEAPHTGAFVRYATIYRNDLIPLGSRP